MDPVTKVSAVIKQSTLYSKILSISVLHGKIKTFMIKGIRYRDCLFLSNILAYFMRVSCQTYQLI